MAGDFGEIGNEFSLKFPAQDLEESLDAGVIVPRKNYTFFFDFYDELPSATQSADPEYEKFLADIWVGVVLTLMVLCCVCCMCSCLLYHKFQQWKRSELDFRRRLGADIVNNSLPQLRHSSRNSISNDFSPINELDTIREASLDEDVEERRQEDVESTAAECESLPSYTLVSGLPTYDEALEQLKKVGELTSKTATSTPTIVVETARPESAGTLQRLSVMDLFQLQKDKLGTTVTTVKM